MAIKYLVVALFFAIVVIKPVHDAYPDPKDPKDDKRHNGTTFYVQPAVFQGGRIASIVNDNGFAQYEPDYLWMYLVFAYFFTGLALYLVIAESRKIIEVRQTYLGSQSTVTDRTIRLSGIPAELQSEPKIKVFIEELEIGQVGTGGRWIKLSPEEDIFSGSLRKPWLSTHFDYENKLI